MGRLVQNRSISSLHHFIPCPDANTITLWEADGAAGVHAFLAEPSEIDVVLFLARLDHDRVGKEDKLALLQVVLFFGEDVLDKLVIVFTHGHALPPCDLTFHEYVRGRADLLWAYVKEVVPPVIIPNLYRPVRESETDPVPTPAIAPVPGEQATDADASNPPEESISSPTETAQAEHVSSTAAIGYREQFLARQPVSADTDPAESLTARQRRKITRKWMEGDMNPVAANVFNVLGNDNDTDEGSVSGLPEDFLHALVKEAVHPLDTRVFKDPTRPPTVVTELSESCPRDQHGQPVLPDGTPWLRILLDTVMSTVASARAKAARPAEELEELEERVRVPGESRAQFVQKLRGMFQSLAKDSLRVFLLEIALLVLFVHAGNAIRNEREKRKAIVPDNASDLLMELSDEEFDRLTKPDPGSGGNFVFEARPPNLSDDESIGDPEADFFEDAVGPAGKRKQLPPKRSVEVPNERNYLEDEPSADSTEPDGNQADQKDSSTKTKGKTTPAPSANSASREKIHPSGPAKGPSSDQSQ